MHAQAHDAVARMAKQLDLDHRANLSILDIGARNINGHLRHLFAATDWTTLDIMPAPEVDIVADACTWTPDRHYDLALCTEVFEHVEGWRSILLMAAVAADTVIVTCASTGRPVHSCTGNAELPDGEWYGNVPAAELDEAMADLFSRHQVDGMTTPHDVYGWGQR